MKRYREILAQHQEPPTTPADDRDPRCSARREPRRAAKPITLAVLGPVKAGKSSLVNALLGKQSATVDRLPVPSGTRYDMTLPGGQPVSLLDTSGYGETRQRRGLRRRGGGVARRRPHPARHPGDVPRPQAGRRPARPTEGVVRRQAAPANAAGRGRGEPGRPAQPEGRVEPALRLEGRARGRRR